jgi:chromate transport protein ChrA
MEACPGLTSKQWEQPVHQSVLLLTLFEQYQELFAICQALPGPGSTKMLFCMALIHAGFVAAIFVFLIWR